MRRLGKNQHSTSQISTNNKAVYPLAFSYNVLNRLLV